MPPADVLKTSIFDYMNKKQGNIVAVVDPKKGSVKEYLQQNQKNCRLVGLNARNTVVADSLKVLFQRQNEFCCFGFREYRYDFSNNKCNAQFAERISGTVSYNGTK